MSNPKTFEVVCSDGVQLAASLYLPNKVKAAVLIAPATGIKRNFYHSFASFLCSHNYAVFTFDNRGIGDSKGRNLNDCNASLINWGKLDMSAALKSLQEYCPDVTYHLIGHSAGGQLTGLMSNAHELTSMFNFGSSSGSLKYSRYPFKAKSYFWLNIFIPFSNLIFKQAQSHWVGMGEPLPIQVGQQWRRWCNGVGYVEVDFNKSIKEHFYDDLSLPSLWIHAADDDIANDDTVKDMIRVYKKTDASVIKIVPQDYGYTDIGHMKFFSSKRERLWQYALNWLSEHID